MRLLDIVWLSLVPLEKGVLTSLGTGHSIVMVPENPTAASSIC